jgi:uncharacterized protein YndB with AHSA1/START domain
MTSSDSNDRELVLTRLIDAPRAKVFQAWTDPELLKQWFAPAAVDTPRNRVPTPCGPLVIFGRRGRGSPIPPVRWR